MPRISCQIDIYDANKNILCRGRTISLDFEVCVFYADKNLSGKGCITAVIKLPPQYGGEMVAIGNIIDCVLSGQFGAFMTTVAISKTLSGSASILVSSAEMQDTFM
jgi:hypothetical protein